jgi:hypothetical protein
MSTKLTLPEGAAFAELMLERGVARLRILEPEGRLLESAEAPGKLLA